MWAAFIDVIRAVIFGAAHLCGGSLGGGVLLGSFALRLALLPLTLRLARHAQARQRRLVMLRPQLDRLHKRFSKDPARLLRETQDLHRKHGIRILDPRPVIGGLAQTPLLAGLFAAVRSGLGAGVRFLWVGDLARPDVGLLLLVAGASMGAASVAPSPGSQAAAAALPIVLAGIVTIAFLWSASSAIALSWGAGSAVSALQGWILREELAPQR